LESCNDECETDGERQHRSGSRIAAPDEYESDGERDKIVVAIANPMLKRVRKKIVK